MAVLNVIIKDKIFFFCVEFIMSNIKKNFFNPGGNNNNAVLPKEKKDTTFDPTYTPKFNLRLSQSLNTKPKIPLVTKTIYKKTGKPLKPNVGSLDRIQRLKAAAFASK
tara:strand:+ start:1224 stop:1547 length:324 start_codon:yes stop_codon:yes gene_type:complete